MNRHFLAALLLVATPARPSEKPTQGKVRIYVSADSSESYRGVQQRSSELEESTRDIRRSLNNSKWLELTENLDDADIRLLVLGRRKDVERGSVLGYFLEAGEFKTKDEFAFVGQSFATGGGRSRDAREMSTANSPRSSEGWDALAKKFAQSLEGFAEKNYARIIAQRKP